MATNKIIKCSECANALRIPANKHIIFTCPHCGRKFEYINGRPLIEARKRKKRFRTFVSIAALLLIGFVVFKIATKPQNIIETQAYAQKDAIYDNFREKYQYQYQMIGRKDFEDNSSLLIISEPPTHISEESLETFFANYNSDLSIRKHRVGYDGWVKDVVVCINGLNEKKFDKMLSKLQTDLFHTDYKSYTIPLDSMPNEQFFLPENLNLQVSSDELYNWFIRDGEKLKKLNPQGEINSETKTLSSFFNAIDANGHFNSPEGIYYSENPGFVVWILSKNSNLDKQKADARKFTIDSDIILGAISNNSYVAIVGREREISVLELPPLRVEVLLLLAQNSDKEDGLAQSFEYNMWFLVKQEQNNHKDWYFAWLCDELINTEYGNLLNWTDHVLKSWTDCNSMGCEYIDFPNPIEYPFGKPLSKEILKCNSLVYNWSSKNLTYSLDYDDIYEIQATLGGTGCLPITYIPTWSNKKDSVSIGPFKEDGYDYFSNLNNPNIARVVQYQTLYQIFQNAEIKYYKDYSVYDYINEEDEYVNRNHNYNVLYRYGSQILKKITSLTDDDIKNISLKIAQKDKKYEQVFKKLKEILDTYPDSELTKEELEFKDNISKSNNVIDFFALRYKQELLDLKETVSSLSSYEKESISKNIASPRIYHNENAKKINTLLKKYAEYLGFNKTTIKDDFINSQNNNMNSWVKTPLIVETWNNLDSTYWEGGNDLVSRTNKFKFSNELTKGKIIDEGKGVYTIAASEKGNIKGILKTHIRENKIGIRNFYADDAVNIAKNRTDIIPAKPRARGFSTTDHLSIKKVKDGFTFITETGETKIVKDYAQLKDYLVTKNQKATIIFEDFSVNEVKATINSADISQTARLSKENLPNFAVDYSTAKYKPISENKFEVTLNFKGKNSNTTLEIKNTPIEKVKNYIDKLGGSNKNAKDIIKDLNIQRNDVKKIDKLIFELDGIIGDNNIKQFNYEKFNGGIMLSTNAA